MDLEEALHNFANAVHVVVYLAEISEEFFIVWKISTLQVSVHFLLRVSVILSGDLDDYSEVVPSLLFGDSSGVVLDGDDCWKSDLCDCVVDLRATIQKALIFSYAN